MMVRQFRLRATLTLALAAAIAVLPGRAYAVTLEVDSPMAGLLGLIQGSVVCGGGASEAQMEKIGKAGEALQAKLGASDADLQALGAKLGNSPPAMGCEQFKANFQELMDKALDAAS